MRAPPLLAPLVLLQMVSVPAPAAGQSASERATQFEIRWGVKIPMRDGVQLNATVYLPRDQRDPLPAIYSMTPYIADSRHAVAQYFAEHGYVFLSADVRGRGNSGGTFEPFVVDAKDGYDAVEWVAKQPWCNGKVAMLGGSYTGFNQWSVAKEFPPHLATIAPTASAHLGVDFPQAQNMPGPYVMQWITFTSGVTGNEQLFGDAAYWGTRFRELYRKHLAFAGLDTLVGNPSGIFRKWLEHPTPDAYWNGTAPTAADYARLTIPILTRTGMYDGDQLGALTYYRRHMQYGNPDAKAKHFLVIGPWDHAGTRTPKKEVGGLTFGDASMMKLEELEQAWYDWTMKGGPRPAFLKQRVAYYVTGAEEWKYADSLEAVAPVRRTYFLTSPGNGASDAFQSGSLAPATPPPTLPDGWTYDPLDTRPGEIESNRGERLLDQRSALNLFGQGLVYHTAPLEEDTEISGFPRLSLWLALDVPDTDFQVALYEIQKDGRSIALTDDQLRARYRESFSQAKPVPAGQVLRYDFERFRFMSRRIAKGSRIRLVIRSPNSIFQQKNYNSGGDVSRETARDARTAHVKLYHDAGHWSALELPVAGDGKP